MTYIFDFFMSRSKDDIFLIYAALYSGENSFILSNDFMRQHKFAIGSRFKKTFMQWQQEHWYGYQFDKNRNIECIQPMKYKMFCHHSDGYWHLPFISDIEKKTEFNKYETPKNWACLRL